MKKISYFRKVKLFLNYRKYLKKISVQLEQDYNARVDGALRIYTVLNVPVELIEEPYNLRKEDIDKLAKNFITEYSNKLSLFLNAKNLMEMYDFYEVKKVDKYSYLLVYGFSLFDSAKFYRIFYITIFTFSFATLLALLFILI